MDGPEALHGRGVQMVVVVVRDDDEVDRRQILEPEAGRHHPARSGERERARALRPLGIGEEAHSVQSEPGRSSAPTHVTVGASAFSRRALPSFGVHREAPRAGEKVDLKRRG